MKFSFVKTIEVCRVKRARAIMYRMSRKRGIFLVELMCHTCNEYRMINYTGKPSEFPFPICWKCGSGVYSATFVSKIRIFPHQMGY